MLERTGGGGVQQGNRTSSERVTSVRSAKFVFTAGRELGTKCFCWGGGDIKESYP